MPRWPVVGDGAVSTASLCQHERSLPREAGSPAWSRRRSTCRATSGVADFGGSPRAGLAALRAACERCAAGSLARPLVVAADARPAPGSEQSRSATARRASRSGPRRDRRGRRGRLGERGVHVRVADRHATLRAGRGSRFGNQYGVARDLPEAVGAALRKAELPPSRVATFCLAPGARRARRRRPSGSAATRRRSSQRDHRRARRAGPVRAARSRARYRRARRLPRRRRLRRRGRCALFRATDALPATTAPICSPGSTAERRCRRTSAGCVRAACCRPDRWARPCRLTSSGRSSSRTSASTAAVARRAGWCSTRGARLHRCTARGRMADQRLGHRGSVFTFTIDNLRARWRAPDADGGGRSRRRRATVSAGHGRAEGVKIDARRLTFRRLHEAGGNRNYFWKARPAGERDSSEPRRRDRDEGQGRRHRRGVHEVRRALRPGLRGSDLRRGLRRLRRRRHRSGRDRGGYLGTYLPGPGGGKSATSLADALRLYGRPITRVENYCATGTDAFRNACITVAAGVHDVVLVVGAEKLKDRGGRGIPRIGHPLLGTATRRPDCSRSPPIATCTPLASDGRPWRG